MFKTISLFILKNLAIAHKGTLIAKFKSVLVLSIFPAFIGLISPLREWISLNGGYVGFVLFAIALDHILGTIVHLMKKDFTFRQNIIGIFVKLGLVFSVGVLFEGFQYIYPSNSTITDYLSMVTRTMVFLYPASSAFMNSAIITNGAFPPIGWIKKIAKFSENADINQFNNNGNQEQTRQDY